MPFDRVWANHLLCDVLRDVRDECLRSQQAPLWRILENQVLRPAVSGAERLGYAELARTVPTGGYRPVKKRSDVLHLWQLFSAAAQPDAVSLV
ncbi:MAG: hypothetical protein U0935_12845 [Pirellulales bacterium]